MDNNNLDLNDLFMSSGFKLANPVKKLNYKDNAKALIGFYLLSIDNYQEVIEDSIDKSNIDENTILFFEQRHIFDIGSILLGLFECVHNIFPKFDVYSTTREILSHISSPVVYKKLMFNTNLTIITIGIPNDELRARVLYIVSNIFFIGYAEIDNLIQKAVDVFKKEGEDGSNTDNSTN